MADVDWLLLGRYGLAVSLTQLIPVPLLDGMVENRIRRRLVRVLAEQHGVTLDDADVCTLGDAPAGGCLGMVKTVVLWPFRKLLRTVLLVLQLKSMADQLVLVVHRGLLVHEALERGWLPGDAVAVRAAMDEAFAKIDVRPIEKLLVGTYRDYREDLNKAVWEATQLVRTRAREERSVALAEAMEGGLGSGAEALTKALISTLRGTGISAELLHFFHSAMGRRVPVEAVDAPA